MLGLSVLTIHWFRHILVEPPTKLLAPHVADGPLGLEAVTPVSTRLLTHFSNVRHVINALELVIEEAAGAIWSVTALNGPSTSGYDPSEAFCAGSAGWPVAA